MRQRLPHPDCRSPYGLQLSHQSRSYGAEDRRFSPVNNKSQKRKQLLTKRELRTTCFKLTVTSGFQYFSPA
jgi:hypothetical protein